MTERKPLTNGWAKISRVDGGSAWQRGRVRVVSTIVDGPLEEGGVSGPYYHLSVSASPRAATEEELFEALNAFDMLGLKIFRMPIAAHVWRPVR